MNINTIHLIISFFMLQNFKLIKQKFHMRAEACAAGGQRVHMDPLFQNRWGICPPLNLKQYVSAPAEKALRQGGGGQRLQDNSVDLLPFIILTDRTTRGMGGGGGGGQCPLQSALCIPYVCISQSAFTYISHFSVF